MKTASGLEYIEIEVGEGAAPQPGENVAVHYSGTLEDGTVFDSSYTRDAPIVFPLGKGRVIRGWDEGIALMRVGGKATLIIPPALAYGAQGAGGVIPPDATLTFDVELVGIEPGAPAAPLPVANSDFRTTASGLRYHIISRGAGPLPRKGRQVLVHYSGWLLDGTRFDSSRERGQPFQFILGQGQVIPGWDEGIALLRVGSTAQLRIPPQLAYGAQGAGGVIPPNAELIFEVELLGVG